LWPVMVTVLLNSCVNSSEDGTVGPKHVEIRRYMNKIEIVKSVRFSFHMLKRCRVQKALSVSPSLSTSG
jgi:hypothetical protein